MKILIVGAGGLVGKEFARQFSNGHQVLALTHSDLDITDTPEVRRMILDESPALIINCAVLGVDACELDPSLAYAVNVIGAKTLAKAADDVDAEFLQISSNFVFGDTRRDDSFYTINDVPTPISMYGQTKLAGERVVVAGSRRSFIVRTSWVFGEGKGNFFSTAPRSLYAAKKIRAITDAWASATYVRDLVSRVHEILTFRYYSTYHVVNDGLCSYYDFALEAGRILKIPDSDLMQLIEPVKLCDLRLQAKRPRYSPMRCTVSEELGLAPLRDWRVALAEHILANSSLNKCQ